MASEREQELERQLKERDAQMAAQAAQMAQLQQQMASLQAAATPRSQRPGSPFGGMPTGIPRGAPPPANRGRPLSPRQAGRPLSPRPTGGAGRPPSRPLSPRGGGAAFGSTVSTARRSSPNAFFHASMRGGPLTEPLPQRGLSDAERRDPQRYIQGPTLLTRNKFGAKKSEWERFKLTDGALTAGTAGGNLFEDDNPFNDPFQYRPFKGLAFPPTDYIGPDDPRETDDMTSGAMDANALRLAFVYGYTGRRARSNLFYNADGRIVYHTAALGIVYDKDSHEQYHFQARASYARTQPQA